MLINLQIKNFLLIDNVEIDLTGGLCVLTGETGAGKSIILNCIKFISGSKFNNKSIRIGQNAASVVAMFDISNNIALKRYINEIGIEIEEDNLIIRRAIDTNNRNKIYLGTNLISLDTLQKISFFLLEIHGQHDKSNLIDEKNHIHILDDFGLYNNLLSELKDYYYQWKEADKKFTSIKAELYELNKEKDYLTHLIKEIESINPLAGEEERLTLKRIELQKKDKLISSFKSVFSEINEVNQVERLLINANKIISKIHSYDQQKINLISEALDRASIEISEVSNLIESAINDLEDSNEDIDDIEKRLFSIKSLSRKYSKPADELQSYLTESIRKLEQLNRQNQDLKSLSQEVIEAKEKYLNTAKTISEKRKQYASILENDIQNELNYLKMDKAKFRVNFKRLDEDQWHKFGTEKIKFEASINPGQEFSELSKTASGGELSRFMLAIKVILSKHKSNIMLIFDEIDSGIGGVVADLLANRLAVLSHKNQILLVTHQAQIAAKASLHLFVKKVTLKNATITTIHQLSINERHDELARMLTGSNITSEVIEVAKQLINTSNII